MAFNDVRAYLELGYFLSQIMLVIIATIAGLIAFLQLRTFKLFEILRYIEAPDFRDARRTVIQKIEKQKTSAGGMVKIGKNSRKLHQRFAPLMILLGL